MQRRDSVRRLAGLRDGDHQSLRVRHGFPIAVFARDLDAAGDAGQRLEPIARDHPRVIARAAGEDQHRIDIPKNALGFRTEKLRGNGLRARHHLQGVRHRHRLLEDFLLHVVAVVSQLDRVGGELRNMHRAAYRLAARVADAHAVEGELGAVAVLEVDDALRDLDERRGVGGREVLAVAEAEEQRRAVASHHQPRAIGLVDDRDRVGADEPGDARAHGVEKRAFPVQLRMHEVRDDLGVGVRGEYIALCTKRRADFVVVFDDAVVHDRHAAGDVGMGILLRRHAVRRPARVRDTDLAGEALRLREPFQVGDAAGRAHTLQFQSSPAPAVQHRDPGGVVAAILQPLQSLDEDGNDVTFGYRSDYSTHAVCLSIISSSPAAASPERTPAWRGRESARLAERPW